MNSRPAQPVAAAKSSAVVPPTATSAPAQEFAPTNHSSPPVSPAPIDAFSVPTAPRFPASLAEAVERCWRRAGVSAAWELTREEFEAALERSAAKRFSGVSPGAKKLETYLDSLHVRDLALALACAKGSPAAWDFFMAEYRPELYRAARAIVGTSTGRDAAARELADSLYADLYGLRESGGRRKSLFDYFHGRSKLTTWLHAVLSQRQVDEIRRTRAIEPLESEAGQVVAEAENPRNAIPAPSSGIAGPDRAQHLAALQGALAAALASLEPRDRLRLAHYYVDGRTLAEIGRLLGEHEATVSRKLDRTRADVRSRVEKWLRERKNWSDAQVRECLECARGEWPFDLSAHLQPASAPGASSDASAAGSTAGGRKI